MAGDFAIVPVYDPITGTTRNRSQTFSGSSDDSDASYGPVIELSFPSYNAGTAHVTRYYVSVMALPTGDFLFVTASLGYAF